MTHLSILPRHKAFLFFASRIAVRFRLYLYFPRGRRRLDSRRARGWVFGKLSLKLLSLKGLPYGWRRLTDPKSCHPLTLQIIANQRVSTSLWYHITEVVSSNQYLRPFVLWETSLSTWRRSVHSLVANHRFVMSPRKDFCGFEEV